MTPLAEEISTGVTLVVNIFIQFILYLFKFKVIYKNGGYKNKCVLEKN